MAKRKRTILMYSRSRGGKTSLIGELAEQVKTKLNLKSLVYSIDKGGTGPLQPYIDLGIVDLIEQEDTDPWYFMNMAAKGMVRSGATWVQAKIEDYGMVAFESMTGFADAFMNSLAEKAAQGVNIGGQANISFVIQGDANQSLKIGGSNMAHYNVVQTRILDEVWKSQKLNVPYIVWTASASKEDDTNAGGKVIGPQVVGKALTAELPRHFDLTFRLDCLPSQGGKPERHILYLGNSIDMASGNAVSLGNTRIPLGGPELPPSIEPASLTGALKLIEAAEVAATDKIRARLSGKG